MYIYLSLLFIVHIALTLINIPSSRYLSNTLISQYTEQYTTYIPSIYHHLAIYLILQYHSISSNIQHTYLHLRIVQLVIYHSRGRGHRSESPLIRFCAYICTRVQLAILFISIIMQYCF